jgi:hypothetical protein
LPIDLAPDWLRFSRQWYNGFQEMIAMSYMTAIETMPRDLQMPMLKVLDAFQRDMREQLAVRREDFDKLQNTVAQLAEAQKRTEQRIMVVRCLSFL